MPTKSFRKSFGFRVFRAFALSVLVVATVLSGLLAYYQNSEMKKGLTKEGVMLSNMLAYNIRTWVFAENREMLKDAVRGVMGQENVLAVMIYNARKQVLVIQRKQSAGRFSVVPDSAPGEKFPAVRKEVFPEITERGGTISFLAPVVLETYGNEAEALYFGPTMEKGVPSVIGYVEVVLDKAALRAEMKSVLLRNGAATVLFLIAGSMAIYLVVKRIMRPLTNLAESVRALGKGELVAKVPVESTDEIGRLARDFNTMSENLKKQDKEKEALAEQLRYAQKMEAVGTLARGIAHDFNNILATLRGSIYLIDKKLRERDELRQYTEQVHGSISRAQTLIRELLTFSRTHRTDFRALDLNVIIGRMKQMLVNMAGEGVVVDIAFSDGPVMVMSDSVQVERILMNLCANGRDAMPDGGVLRISTEIVTVDVEKFSKEYPPMSGRYALITVSDTGPGIDEETKERIFEPYFTTKDIGKGTGLGLAIVYGIVKQHSGWIWVDSEPGRGSAFRIYLPVLENNGPNMENRRI